MPYKRLAACCALLLSTAGCMTYRGPLGVEAAIERKAQVTLHREMGVKLGPISTKIATSFLHSSDGDMDYRDLTGIGVAVFEVTGRKRAPAERITAKDLGVEGWQSMFETRSPGEQLLVLARAEKNGEIREMMLLSIEDDEVVVARLKGHLDRLLQKTLDAADRDGARGARAAIGAGTN